MRPHATLPFLLALLTGCAVGPNFRRPETHEPAVLRGQAAPEERSLADLAWWNLYRDPALTALVQASLADGYDASIAASRVEQARAIETEAHGQLFPSLGYSGNAYRGKNAASRNEVRPIPPGGTTSDAFNGYFSASWEPDIWGKLRRLDEAARAQYLESEEVHRGVLLSLVGEVATDYFQLLELDEELAISREAAESFGQSFRLFNQRLQGGIASQLETSSAQADQAAAEARIPEIERETAILEDQLGVLLGRNPGPIARATRLSDHSPAPEAPPGLPSALLERRPDVRAAEYAARAANAQIGVTIGSFLPKVGLSAVFGGVSDRLQSVASRQAGLWSAGAQVSGPLFQGGALRGQYLQAKAAWEEAKLQYQRAALNAFADAANALIARQKLAAVRAQDEIEVSAFRKATTVAFERYKAGEASYYELLQVQQQLYPAESALAQARRDELTSIVQLYKALGGGWNLSDPAWLKPEAEMPSKN